MAQSPRPIAFVLASTDHGTMIVNRFDYRTAASGDTIGVGHMLLSHSSYEAAEADMALRFLTARRKHFGDGVTVLDIGANIGAFTVEWAKHMTGWGNVVAFEPQERIFYALCGNIAINNCFNARIYFAAVASSPGTIAVPRPNYMEPGSFGSLELRKTPATEDIGQPIDYSKAGMMEVQATTIDTMALPRLDLVKVDVEGMEMEVLEGARQSIDRHRPIMIVERIKSDEQSLIGFLADRGYRTYTSGLNIVAIHADDPTLGIVRERPPPA